MTVIAEAEVTVSPIQLLRSGNQGKLRLNTGPTEEELAISYDALRQTITVGSETYHLAKGNLFVVRLDENWHPEITQLEMTNNKDIGVEEVISAFKSALRQDRIVQQL